MKFLLIILTLFTLKSQNSYAICIQINPDNPYNVCCTQDDQPSFSCEKGKILIRTDSCNITSPIPIKNGNWLLCESEKYITDKNLIFKSDVKPKAPLEFKNKPILSEKECSTVNLKPNFFLNQITGDQDGFGSCFSWVVKGLTEVGLMQTTQQVFNPNLSAESIATDMFYEDFKNKKDHSSSLSSFAGGTVLETYNLVKKKGKACADHQWISRPLYLDDIYSEYPKGFLPYLTEILDSTRDEKWVNKCLLNSCAGTALISPVYVKDAMIKFLTSLKSKNEKNFEKISNSCLSDFMKHPKIYDFAKDVLRYLKENKYSNLESNAEIFMKLKDKLCNQSGVNTSNLPHLHVTTKTDLLYSPAWTSEDLTLQRKTLLNHLQRSLNEKTISGVNYCANVYYQNSESMNKRRFNDSTSNDNKVKECGYHASLVVGREWRKGQCHFRIKNSWGSTYRPINSTIEKENEDFLIPEDQFEIAEVQSHVQ